MDGGHDMRKPHFERHYAERIGWLRAAVMGANDGIVSTASLVVGVAAANAARPTVLVSGVAGLVAGAMSMAAGEYVSVSSQADTEKADLDRERRELETDAEFERKELAEIYVARGLEPSLAQAVADQLMAHDALGPTLDELADGDHTARLIQAALARRDLRHGRDPALVAVLVTAPRSSSRWLPGASLVFLAIMGGVAARTGVPGRRRRRSRDPVGALAMAATAAVGTLFGGVP
jgi:VIT1/CCC1 family predicted Fe2+/Mn2+ transporter